MRKQHVYSSGNSIDGKEKSCYTVFRQNGNVPTFKGGVTVKRRYVVGICLIVWAICIALSSCSTTTYELPADTSAIEEYIETTSVILKSSEEIYIENSVADEERIAELLSAE